MKKITLFEEINRMKTLMNVNVLTEAPIPKPKALEKSAEELWNYSKKLLGKTTARNAEETVESALERLKTIVGSDAEQYLESIGKQIGRVEIKQVEKEIVEFLSKNKVAQENIFANLKINFENEIEELITKTAKSPEIRDAWDDLYSQALRYSGGDIEQAQNDLREMLKDELSDVRILEKYFENLEVVEDDLGNWIVKPKREPDVINPPTPERTPENGGDGSTPNEPIAPEELEIFNPATWGELPKLNDKQIKELINLNIWDNVVRKFESLFNPSKARLKYIQQLANSIENATNTELQGQLRTKLKKELEWLYKKNTNNFVAMKDYFDTIARTNRKFGQVWDSIKSYSNGGWDFYKSFGIMAENISTFDRVMGGLKQDLKVLYEIDLKYGIKIINAIGRKEVIKPAELTGSFWKNLYSGSRRGFPTMSNPHYQKIIEKFGPTGAKAAYFRDLVVGTLKWNMYAASLVTLRNALANSVYEDNVSRCLSTNNLNSKECIDLNDNLISRKMAEWSMAYRINPEESGNVVKKWLLEIIGPKENMPKYIESDTWYKKLAEISTLDPGMIGEIINFIATPFNYNDNPERKKQLLSNIDEQIKLAQEEARKADEKVEEVIEEVKVDTTNWSGDAAGFKAFCLATKNSKFRSDNNIDKEYTYSTWNGLSGKTVEKNSLGTNDWYWVEENKTFKPFN